MRPMFLCLAFVASTVLGGCVHLRVPPEAPGPGEGSLVLREPHWDQVCRPDRSPMVFRHTREVLRSPASHRGAPDELAERLDVLLPPVPAGGPFPFVDAALTFDRSGAIRSFHLANHNVDERVAEAVIQELSGQIRESPSLLHPVFLRVRVTRAPALEILLLPALHCLPHVTHEVGEPPRFLGDARVVGGGPLSGPMAEVALRVRLLISPAGGLEDVAPLQGNPELLDSVRASLAKTRFDPALINGEPIPGTLDLIFIFEPRAAEMRHIPPPRP